jgi:hypothetical protein
MPHLRAEMFLSGLLHAERVRRAAAFDRLLAPSSPPPTRRPMSGMPVGGVVTDDPVPTPWAGRSGGGDNLDPTTHQRRHRVSARGGRRRRLPTARRAAFHRAEPEKQMWAKAMADLLVDRCSSAVPPRRWRWRERLRAEHTAGPEDAGRGTRVLGVPTVAERIAQTVAVAYLEPLVEPVFHPDSYGYVCPEQEGSLM